MAAKSSKISIVVPVYNEVHGLDAFHKSLLQVLKQYQYELIYVDDGSTDGSLEALQKLARKTAHTKLIRLSRNFGKELATTAGIHAATGDAVITIDGDGQHPAELIPAFIQAWQNGAKVVIGRRTTNQHEGAVKHWGSKVFYKLFNTYTGVRLMPGSTDFRLIDREVQSQFNAMTERNRITRGLIDWLGYDRTYLDFTANPRLHGTASYSFGKLFKLAVDSVISLSLSPLYVTAWIGAIVLPISVLAGLVMTVDYLAGNSLHLTGAAFALILVLFLMGIVLVSQGIIGLYLSHIHTETQNRPLYVIDQQRSL